MDTYRQKDVTVKAVQCKAITAPRIPGKYEPCTQSVDGIDDPRVIRIDLGGEHWYYLVYSYDGTFTAVPGDWIVFRSDGIPFVLPDEIFKRKYEGEN